MKWFFKGKKGQEYIGRSKYLYLCNYSEFSLMKWFFKGKKGQE